jgi:hypothetical protein
MKTHIGLTIAGLLLSATAAQAGTATLQLGASTQNFTEYGLGNDTPKGPGFSLWDMQQGSCTTATSPTTVTTCTLSGSYTSSVTGISSGTYSFVTSYDGAGPNGTTNAGPNAPIGVSETALSNYFNYVRVTPSTNMDLTLDMGLISLNEQMVIDGKIAPGANFSFLFVPPEACSGVSIAPAGCGPYNVGQVAGAIYSAPATMSVTFAYTPTPPVGAPEPGTLGLLGLSGIAMLGARKRRKTAA